jgi:hypothetical protein
LPVGTIIVVVVLAILSAAVALLAAGLVEVYAELRQVRAVLHMQDEPLRLSLDTLGREVGELVPDPPEPMRLDPMRPSYVLVLSNTCSICHTIGSGLASSSAPWAAALTVLIASDSAKRGRDFAAALGLNGPRVIVDDQGRYAKQLGVDTSPTVVKVEHGRLTAAANLTSLRQLEVFVDGRAAVSSGASH